MVDDLKSILERRKANKERLAKEAPDLYNGFNEMIKHYYKTKALDRRQKELIAVACSVARSCFT
jgi:alkylhydroperoxidase/carboxymuconolactone decarboxylase family protein YurZ